MTWAGGLPGMYVGVPLDPPVKLDRDGKPFTLRQGRTCTGAYDYPEPKPSPGWKKLAVALPAEGVRQSAAAYAKDGNLLRTLLADAAGARELWWDGRDDTGRVLEAGTYEIRHVVHDVQVLDDGAVGDNGNPLGTYNCDNAQRVVAYPDGSFVISTLYDEAGIPLCFYAPSGQPVSGSALSQSNVWALAAEGKDKNLIAGVNRELQRIVPPGERLKMPNGAAAYPILVQGELLAKAEDGKKDLLFGGVAVTGGRILVSVPLAGGNVVRVFELATGRKVADWPVPAAGDLDPDAEGNAWILCGEEVVCLNPQGQIARRLKAGLPGSFLAVGKTQLAVISGTRNKVVLLNMADRLSLGMCITSGTVGGRQYLLVYGHDHYTPTEEEKKNNSYSPRRYVFLDVTDPLAPRYAGFMRSVHPLVYTDVRFDKDGNLCWPDGGGRLRIAVNKFLGRDEKGLLRYTHLGLSHRPETPLEYRGAGEKDPAPRGMFHKGGLSIDLGNNDHYLLACTALSNKMVPAWGASGTGVGKLSADGRPLWFTPSSGGNYTSISSVAAANELWVMAAKDFGGQVDVYTRDGLRLSTSSVGWGCHWTSGFVDAREGKEWAANYPMPNELVWGAKLGSVADHPLGQLLGSALGASLEGKPGYTLMAKIPLEEIKLVGGIAGRKGGEILPMKGEAGEILRVGVSFDGMSVWGRTQDFKVYWPVGLMFSDPTSFVPVVLGQ